MVGKISDSENIGQIELLLKEGPFGVKCDGKYSIVERPWEEKAVLIGAVLFFGLTQQQKDELNCVYSLAGLKIQMLKAHKNPTILSYSDTYKPGWREWVLNRLGIATDLFEQK